jgi:hypothetical protein
MFPSLFTVTDRFRVMPRNREDLVDLLCGPLSDLSPLGLVVPSLLRLVLLPRLFILKKFLNLVGK